MRVLILLRCPPRPHAGVATKRGGGHFQSALPAAPGTDPALAK